MKRYPVRKRLRLKGYPYDRAGAYFLTIIVRDRLPLFGEIRNGEMAKNPAGDMIEKWYAKLEEKFSDIWCGPMVVMPDHFHAIIINRSISEPNPVYLPELIDTKERLTLVNPTYGEDVTQRTHLFEAIRWFKTMTTNAYIKGVKSSGWPRFNGKLWLRSYHEKVITSERMFACVADYIALNPKRADPDS